MKKKIMVALLGLVVLLTTGCSISKEAIDPDFAEQLEEQWEYTSPNTSYNSTYDSEYWNYCNTDDYAKMYYEAVLNDDFSDSNQKNIYLFYGDEVDKYSLKALLKAIQFVRLDYPEHELMDWDFGVGSKSTKEDGKIYESLSYYVSDYDEYMSKLAEVNEEIKDLVDEVNHTEDVVEKHRLIFNWLTSNITYLKSDSAVGTIEFDDEEFLLARLETDSTQNIYGAIVEKKAVCDGIADAYKYICNQCNLECMIVDGYINDITQELYHAWNIVKIEDRWYLVDATWDIGNEYPNYFLVKDLTKGDRTPLNMGYDLPGYDLMEKDIKTITFSNHSEQNSVLTSNEGITFKSNDIYASSKAIYSWVDSKNTTRDVLVKTNAKVKKVEYFDYNGSLLGVCKIDDGEYYFPEYLKDIYVLSANVYLEYKGETYKVEMGKGGA